MADGAQGLGERLRELRRRHFGPRGKEEFARRLGLEAGEYERFERGAIPSGELLVRICELTGEDLQWLLTGVAARGTVVISGTRTRHQELLTRLARLLDEQPRFAAPVEAFVDLLLRGDAAQSAPAPRLPETTAAAVRRLIPIFDFADLPAELPGGDDDPDRGPHGAAPGSEPEWVECDARRLLEPVAGAPAGAAPLVRVIEQRAPGAAPRRFLADERMAQLFDGMFGARLDDARMSPLLQPGETLLVAPGAAPRTGRPALCRLRDPDEARCRIWLGERDGLLHLGCVADGAAEQIPPARLCWSLEVLFRLAA